MIKYNEQFTLPRTLPRDLALAHPPSKMGELSSCEKAPSRHMHLITIGVLNLGLGLKEHYMFPFPLPATTGRHPPPATRHPPPAGIGAVLARYWPLTMCEISSLNIE